MRVFCVFCVRECACVLRRSKLAKCILLGKLYKISVHANEAQGIARNGEGKGRARLVVLTSVSGVQELVACIVINK